MKAMTRKELAVRETSLQDEALRRSTFRYRDARPSDTRDRIYT